MPKYSTISSYTIIEIKEGKKHFRRKIFRIIIMHVILHGNCYAPINVSPHPPSRGEVGQSWGFDPIRIQLPHPLGNVRIQILTGHVSHAHFNDSISRPLGQACHSKQGKFPTLSGVGGVGANIDRRIRPT